MSERLPVHHLDPADGDEGDGIIIAGGEFIIAPVASSGTYVVSDGVPTLHGGATEPVSAADGDLWYDRDATPPSSGGAVLVPLTTTVGGVPELVWTDDDELIFVEVDL